ncbi:hypothetical protein L3Q82_012493, partial [Scortum barcoo]
WALEPSSLRGAGPSTTLELPRVSGSGAGVGLLIAPQLSRHVLEFTPVNERVRFPAPSGQSKPQPGLSWRQKLGSGRSSVVRPWRRTIGLGPRLFSHRVYGSLPNQSTWLFGLCTTWSWSLVRIAGSKSDLFPVHVGLRQGCPLSPVLFIIFMDRISRRSQGPEGVQFGNHRISSMLCEKMEREIDRRIGAASAVMRSVFRTVVVKKELSRKAKFSIYRSIYVLPPSPMVMNFG